MSDCRCGHDRLMHHELAGPCLILTVVPAGLAAGCGCSQFVKTPAPKVKHQ